MGKQYTLKAVGVDFVYVADQSNGVKFGDAQFTSREEDAMVWGEADLGRSFVLNMWKAKLSNILGLDCDFQFVQK